MQPVIFFVFQGHRHICGQYDLPGLQAIQHLIFNPDITKLELAQLMGDKGMATRSTTERGKFVNWQRIEEHSQSPELHETVEFHQRHGTDHFDDIAHWVPLRLSSRSPGRAKGKVITVAPHHHYRPENHPVLVWN